jgi:hypothetical protein
MSIEKDRKLWLLAALMSGALVVVSCRKAEEPAAKGAPAVEGETAVAEKAAPATTTAAATEAAASPCAPGTQCKAVDANGTVNPAGASRAQCSGSFPDYVVPASLIPAGYSGPWFKLAQNFPATAPPATKFPWESIDFRKGVKESNAYLYALRDYAFQGNIPVDFRVELNKVRPWYHMPMMNFGPGQREFVHGVTKERTVKGPELGLKPGVSVTNYAVGFFNEQAGNALRKIWLAKGAPDLKASQFPKGTMVFKILFSAAKPTDFQDPAKDPLAGAPEWQVATPSGLLKIRLLQMDVAARDPRAGVTGWVFGTFAYDPTAPDPINWNRLRPVGLMWGNDPGYTPTDQANGKPLKEGFVSDQVPAYAKAHLGWAGRVNGPVDNPMSACMSCHGTAQYPVDAPLLPGNNCTTDAQKLFWFRDFSGSKPFGAVDSTTCKPKTVTTPATPLDFSLQVQVAAQNVLQYKDLNPCMPATPEALEKRATMRETDAPRVSRDGTFDRDKGKE